MKRIEAYFILNELWKDANEKQREAISIAQNDIEFVDLMPEEVAKRLKGAMTNADYIRSMSDEELAKVLSPHIAVKGACNCRRDWTEELLEWLKMPYKEKEE